MSIVGQEASEAAWLIIQYAIGQPTFMKRCRNLLEIAVKEKTGRLDKIVQRLTSPY